MTDDDKNKIDCGSFGKLPFGVAHAVALVILGDYLRTASHRDLLYDEVLEHYQRLNAIAPQDWREGPATIPFAPAVNQVQGGDGNESLRHCADII